MLDGFHPASLRAAADDLVGTLVSEATHRLYDCSDSPTVLELSEIWWSNGRCSVQTPLEAYKNGPANLFAERPIMRCGAEPRRKERTSTGLDRYQATISQSEAEGQGTMSWLLTSRLRSFNVLKDRPIEGQGLVEYALILLLICIACLAAITALGDAIVANLWSLVVNVLIPALGV